MRACWTADLPQQNRVQPDGRFLATAARGTIMGNRGVLHDAQGNLGTARWKHRAWVCCEVSFRGRHRPIMPANRWTALFFLDEAVALAAGHRPCGQCRHADYRAFAEAWADADGHWPGPSAADARLHLSRAVPGARHLRHHTRDANDLPPGAMCMTQIGPLLIDANGEARAYRPDGYGPAQARPQGMVTVLTNPWALRTLAAGYKPRLHPSATR